VCAGLELENGRGEKKGDITALYREMPGLNSEINFTVVREFFLFVCLFAFLQTP